MIIFQKYKELRFLIYFLAISTRTKVHLDYPAAIYSKDIFVPSIFPNLGASCTSFLFEMHLFLICYLFSCHNNVCMLRYLCPVIIIIK